MTPVLHGYYRSSAAFRVRIEARDMEFSRALREATGTSSVPGAMHTTSSGHMSPLAGAPSPITFCGGLSVHHRTRSAVHRIE